MGSTLTNGIYLPAEGERNCYTGLAANWTALDSLIGGYNAHIGNATIHVTAEDKQAWNNHIADTVKHVTAEDKAKWDTVTGKADASALTAHTGDTTIHVTAEDKAKWDTVTGKANDADVVHKEGAETIPGTKTFSDNLSVYNSDTSGATPGINIRSSLIEKGDTANADNLRLQFLDKYNNYVAAINASKNIAGTQYLQLSIGTKDNNNANVSSTINYFISKLGDRYFTPYEDNSINLGTLVRKWKGTYTYNLNGLNPGALFLPQDRTARVDISAYFTATADGDTNRMTAPDDGYIFLALTDVLVAHCFSQTSNNLTHYGQTFGRNNVGLLYVMFPIRKNDVFACQWYTTATAVTVNNAFFIPCKGNV